MKKTHVMVKEFHRAFDVPIGLHGARFTTQERMALRLALIEEEHAEVELAVAEEGVADVAKELADLVYVCYGMAIEMGFDLDAVVREVHRSNMTKVWESAREVEEAILDDDNPAVSYSGDMYHGYAVYRADGKVLKPPTYQPAQVAEVLGL